MKRFQQVALVFERMFEVAIKTLGDGGMFQSTDGGITWSKLPFPGDNVVALAVSPAQPMLVLAITVKGQQGLVYRSEDGGQRWSRP